MVEMVVVEMNLVMMAAVIMCSTVRVSVEQGRQAYNNYTNADAGNLETHVSFVLKLRKQNLSESYVKEDARSECLENKKEFKFLENKKEFYFL